MRFLLSLIALLIFFFGCTHKEVAKANDALAEAVAYYRKNPEFFVFASPADLPKDLAWQDGHDVVPLGDPRALRGGTIHDFLMDFPSTFRLVGPDSNGASRAILQGGLSLLGFDPNTLKPYPALARQWAISPDKMTVYFRLDPAARFSDGEPVRAANYLFAFYFFRSDHIHDPWYVNFYTTEYKKLIRFDDYTIAITLAKARPDFLEKAGGLSPLPMKFYSELGDDYPERYQWRFEPTTGPYEVRPSDVRKGQSITLRRVKNWWADNNKFCRYRFNPEAIEYKVIRDPNKAFELFLAGKLDVFSLNLPEYWYDRAPNAPAVKHGYIQRAIFYNDVPRPTWGFYLNTQDALLKDIHVRRGLAYSLNWERVLKFFFRGDFERLPGYATGYGRFSDPAIKPPPFDLENAAKEFSLAGFTSRGPDGILRRTDGTRLTITVTAAETPTANALMMLKEDALKAGVNLDLEILDPTTAFKKVSEKKHQAAFTAFEMAAGERFPRFWEMFHSVNAKPQTNNLCMLSDPTVDALIDRYDKETDENQIQRLSYQLQEKIADQCVFIPAFMRPWYRVGYWRHIKVPDYFDVKTGEDPTGTGVFWIDEAARKETMEAMRSGKSYDNSVKTYDQWRSSK
jgi:microcin C transport system substrate-binding protein